MPYRIKSRVYAVGKKIKDLIPELRAVGIIIGPSLLSDYISTTRTGRNADMVLAECDKIITGWENNRK